MVMEEEVKESLDFDAEEEGFEVYTKTLLAPSALATVAPTPAPVVPVGATDGEGGKVKKEEVEKDN